MQNCSETEIQHTQRQNKNVDNSTNWNGVAVRDRLQQYLDLGLIPIPLTGKKPLVRWKNWQPSNIAKVEPYIRQDVNWGIKTGTRLTVIDFDSKEKFIDFAVKNIDKLPANMPIVRTGRGYHIWLKPKRTVRNQSFAGIDVKGKGGYVVAPPSIHPNGNHYHFISSFNGQIPAVDLEELDLTGITQQKHSHTHIATDREFSTDNWESEPIFDWDIYKDGVNEGQRHNVLVKYLGWLISRDFSKSEITILATNWNQHNRPPLSEEELSYTIESCWISWNNKNVPNKTLNQINRVLIGTKPNSDVSGQPKVYAYSFSRADPEDWELEEELHPSYFCGYKSRIVRNGRKYASINFFCNRWDCLRCGPHFRKRWLNHIVNKAQGRDPYVASCHRKDWGHLRRRINRHKANYVRIDGVGGLTILVDLPLKGFDRLPIGNLVEFLEKTIPTDAKRRPISTSRGWEQDKNTKSENDYKLVMNTWLGREKQVEIAEALGADITSPEEKIVKPDNKDDLTRFYVTWVSPEDVDEEVWERLFIEAIRCREEEIELSYRST